MTLRNDDSSGHTHQHGEAGHVHGSNNEKALRLAVLLTGVFMLIEVTGGYVSGSLALLADAGHMLTDFGALLLAWFAIRLAARPADWKRTYGFDRFSVLAAFVNGVSLFIIALLICVEAASRVTQPIDVEGGLMLWVAIGGFCVNLLVFWILSRGEKHNLNIRASALHVAGDLLGSIAAIVASLVILTTGWTLVDPLLSVLVALIILRSAWFIVRESGNILLEGAPSNLDTRTIRSALESSIDGVQAVAHIHTWSITQERPMATMEVRIAHGADPAAIKQQVKDYMRDSLGVAHVTVEIDRDE